MKMHVCANIKGMLDNCKRKGSLENVLSNKETGRYLTDAEARAYLHDCIDKGWKVIPMGDCDNFDYQTGCRGHKDKIIDEMNDCRQD